MLLQKFPILSPLRKINVIDEITSIVTAFFREGCVVANPSHLVWVGGDNPTFYRLILRKNCQFFHLSYTPLLSFHNDRHFGEIIYFFIQKTQSSGSRANIFCILRLRDQEMSILAHLFGGVEMRGWAYKNFLIIKTRYKFFFVKRRVVSKITFNITRDGGIETYNFE